ncbi:hypothetical protein [Actinomadura sp. WMMB 499]|uniref:hypothetical protein n=1 Tax=Actinomadura sp. WMMB 499 TaxID=1219491 RepID=UPI0012458805|nr:hypothetical protein [Actinomadura sp. WMMB 499]QFG25577.1 hypothetical protein F7P10_34985 [Actinomadura sp. WMMB 499]
MTVIAHPHGRTDAPAAPGRFRLAVCAGTIAACVPYLTIKLAWLSGSTVGWNDVEAARDSGLYVANAITMAMDAVAVVIALAFTFRWGLRLPAWLVLAPIWIAAGLLAPIVIAVPPAAVVMAFDGSAAEPGASDAMQGWVFAVVYGGFILQAVGLLTAFVLYARARWGDVLTARARDIAVGATHGLQLVLARTALVFAVVFALPNLYWAFGGTSGRPDGPTGDLNVAQHILAGAGATLAVAGAAALLLVLRRADRPRRFVRPLAVAWIGSAATFAWPLFSLVAVLTQPGEMGHDMSAATNMTSLTGVFAGLLMGLAGAALLAEHAGAVRPGTAVYSAVYSARPTASSTP